MTKRFLWCLAAVALSVPAEADFTVYFMRHGQTDWNLEKRLQGSIGYTDLTEVGVAMAERSAAEVQRQGIKFDRVYTSPLRRAVHTAEIMALPQRLDVTLEDRIRERCCGTAEGKTYADSAALAKIISEAKGVESVDQVRARVEDFLERELKPLDGKVENVLCVAHTLVLNVIAAKFAGGDAAKKVIQPNCCMHVIDFKNGEFKLRELAKVFYDQSEFTTEAPSLVVGVLSDVHMNPDYTADPQMKRFRKALGYFDKRKCDAVICTGDMIELGWHQWYRTVGKIWFECFPNNRRSDGAPIEKVFIYGDHEIENYWNPNITRRYSKEYIAERDIPTYGRARNYIESLKEPWAPIMTKRVKGYDFVLAHFTMKETPDHWGSNIPGLSEFFATNSFDRTKPLFYLQHKPIKNTVIAPGENTTDGSTKAVLSDYPNAVAFCGHRHKSATSERSIWQGAFTCVEVPALETVQTDAGHENGWASSDGYGCANPPQQMQKIRPNPDGGQFLLMKVYKNRIVLERWNVDFMEKVAADWVIPLPNRGAASFEARARAAKRVAFPKSAKVSVLRRMGPDRAGTTNLQYVVTFPQAHSDADHARGYDYRVTAEIVKHHWKRTSCEKWVYSDKCYLPEARDANNVVCVFSAAEVPEASGHGQRVNFKVTPYNAFGQPGESITTDLPTANLDRGGTTFDFNAISERRFPAITEKDNLVAGARSGGSESKIEIALPDDSEAPYAIDFQMRMTQTDDYHHEGHSNGGCYIQFDNQPRRTKLDMLVPSGDWLHWRREVKSPKGAKKLTITFSLKKAATFEFKDLAVARLPSPPPYEMRRCGMYGLGDSFAVPRGQFGLLMFEFRKQSGLKVNEETFEVEVSLPRGIEFIDTSMGELKGIKRVVKNDGSTLTTFKWKNLWPCDVWNYWDQRAILVKAEKGLADGSAGFGKIRVISHGKQVIECDPIEFIAVPPIGTVAAPRRYANGSDFSNSTTLRLMNTDSAKSDFMKFMANCGYRMMICSTGDRAFFDLVHASGIRTCVAQSFGILANGYMFGEWSGGVPEAIRFVHNLGSDDGHFAELNRRAVCPICVYSESEWFKREWLPKFRRAVDGADGVWANWEPYMFINCGCFCDRCREEFKKFSGLGEAELAKDWPKGKVPKDFVDNHREAWAAFRSREHARVIRTVDKYANEFCKGEKGLGFLPGVEWADMSTCRRDENLAAQYRPFEYASDLRWIEPWGPYAAWESDKPYFYQKYKPIAQYFAAADVKREVEQSCPEGKRPKLVSYPQGFQSGGWLTQPETIALGLDSYFFNRWDASTIYFFPKGADARYWQRFAEATARAGKYEDYVLDGKEVTGTVSARPVGEYATPVSYATRYVPWSKNASMLQLKAFELKSRRIVAALNFWEKGEAFFTLKVGGLADGRYRVIDETGAIWVKDRDNSSWSAKELASGIFLQVGAARTKVFEIVPEGESISPKAVLTVEDVQRTYSERRDELRKAAEEDARYEKANPTAPRDYMPMI